MGFSSRSSLLIFCISNLKTVSPPCPSFLSLFLFIPLLLATTPSPCRSP